jgi:hypothetical protein
LAIDIGLSLMLTLAAIFSSSLLSGGWNTTVAISNQWPTGSEQFWALAAGTGVSFFVMFVVAFWQLLRNQTMIDPAAGVQAATKSIARRVFQLALGTAFAIFVLAPKWGVHSALLLAALCNVGLIVWNFRSLGVSDTAMDDVEGETIKKSTASGPQIFELIARLGVVFVCGFSFVCWQRYLDQLMLQGSWVTSLEWIVVVTFAAIGLKFAASRLFKDAEFWAATCGVISLAVFPLIVGITLDVSSYVSQVTLVALIRGVIVTTILAPLGIAIGVQLSNLRSHASAKSLVAPTFTFGVVTAIWLIAMQPTGVFLCAASVALAVFGVCRIVSNRPVKKELRRPAFLVATLACLFTGLAYQQYQPQRSAKLLFDTTVFLANRYEKNSEVLQHLDEARCIATTESENGTLTLWRLRGTQLQLRESGLPISAVSTQTHICPSPSAETLRAIIPLTLVERPHRVVIVRSGIGTTLQTSLLFPIEHIDCIEPDQRAFKFVSDHVHGQSERNPLADDRVHIHHCDPQLALATLKDPCDVVMIDAGQFSVGSAASELTREFLIAVAHCLTKDGIASMRFQYVDFGPGAVKVFVETWRSVFSKSGAIETAPGEWLLLGANGDRDLIPADYVKRLHKQHVRLALSKLGWDWSTPLSLAFYQGSDFEAAFHGTPKIINTATNVRLTSWLPWEVMRWGRKYEEIARRLHKHGQQLRMLVKDGNHKDVRHRMAELDLQRDIIHDHADEYWYYRGRVKSRLKREPRSELIHVKGEKPVHKLHPEDKNRLKYFAQLGKVARLAKPDAAALLAISRFAEPYDPLITFFMHEDVAQFASRNRDEVADLELAFRLYRVHFTSPRDKSIRNITNAIDILCEYEDCVDSPVLRADHLDALLQILHQRWQNRGEVAPSSSPIVMTEIEMSISAAEKAFKVLKKSCKIRNVSQAAWAARQRAIEKSLVRPLRTYRTLLLQHRG